MWKVSKRKSQGSVVDLQHYWMLYYWMVILPNELRTSKEKKKGNKFGFGHAEFGVPLGYVGGKSLDHTHKFGNH